MQIAAAATGRRCLFFSGPAEFAEFVSLVATWHFASSAFFEFETLRSDLRGIENATTRASELMQWTPTARRPQGLVPQNMPRALDPMWLACPPSGGKWRTFQVTGVAFEFSSSAPIRTKPVISSEERLRIVQFTALDSIGLASCTCNGNDACHPGDQVIDSESAAHHNLRPSFSPSS